MNQHAENEALATPIEIAVTNEEVIACFRTGAKGLFSSEYLKFDLFCTSIRCVFSGEIWASNKFVGHMAKPLSGRASRYIYDSKGRPLLTKREQQIFAFISRWLEQPQTGG